MNASEHEDGSWETWTTDDVLTPHLEGDWAVGRMVRVVEHQGSQLRVQVVANAVKVQTKMDASPIYTLTPATHGLDEVGVEFLIPEANADKWRRATDAEIAAAWKAHPWGVTGG